MNTIDVIYEYDRIVSKLAEDIKKSDYKGGRDCKLNSV